MSIQEDMNNHISKIDNNVQDRNSLAWHRLCTYIDQVADEERIEFSPFEALGPELFSQIHTLPESIGKLKKVKRVWLYGSSLQRIPPEIGEMEALEEFDPYTSYGLHWFPYEIMHCKHLVESRVSTRALYGNYKNRMGFPNLMHNPVRYLGETVKCSICKKEMTYAETNQLWVSLRVATDVLPLLANVCSKECESRIPVPIKAYVQVPHKGGAELQQPSSAEWEPAYTVTYSMEEWEQRMKAQQKKPFKPLKLIRKLWER